MYTYSSLCDDIAYLSYNGVVTGSIGKSLLNNEIFYLHTGSLSGSQMIVTGAIHARENVTASLVIRQVYRLMNKNDMMGIYFLPMLNPDGAVIIEKNGDVGDFSPFLLSVNGGSNFSLWKANARAVDLNVNFDAKFGRGKGNVTHPASHGFIGAAPFSEPETSALRDFTLKVKPVFTVSYHALGREVYWQFTQDAASALRDKAMADKIGDFLGYKVVDGDLSSAGGYKDWCVTIGIPAVTIEIGSGALTHPVRIGDVKEDIAVNLELIEKLPDFYRSVYIG